MSLDWTQLTGHIDPIEAGSETVRGGYVWIAARPVVEATLEVLKLQPKHNVTSNSFFHTSSGAESQHWCFSGAGVGGRDRCREHVCCTGPDPTLKLTQ